MPAGNGQRTFDEATTTAMLNAFDAAMAECKLIAGGVSNAQGELAGFWQGAASATFTNSMSQWLTGFQKVQNGLNELNGSMSVYRQVTSSTESSNASAGSGWATGGH